MDRRSWATISFISVFGLAWWLVPVRLWAQESAASLKVSPSSGIFEVGSLVDVSFVLDTGGDAVNAISADVLFPPDKLQVVNPVASTSFVTVWVTSPTYSNTDGTISFQGGLPNPGIRTNAGVVSTVTFRVKSAGKAIIKYAPTSQVLRNDAEGTNILTATSSAEYTLKNPPPAGPVVNSPSHPDSNQWYNNPSIQFTWEGLSGITGYSFSFDQNPKGIPDEEVDTTSTATTVKTKSDGIWYFHLRAEAEIWGGVTTYTVRIDTSPPAEFSPHLDHEVATKEDTVLLSFLTSDAASGLDHYEVKEVPGDGRGGDTLFVEAISPYTIQPHPAGKYTFIVRAVDRAGNATEGAVTLRVVAGALPFLARIPLLNNPAVANAMIIGLGVLVAASTGYWVLRRVRIRTTFRRDLETLERDARKKAAALQREMEEIRRAEKLIHQNLGHDAATGPFSPPPTAPSPPPLAS
ncbi:MAG: hypothetical protein HYY50_04500 [Candidatus Kerfeldbacteria bacterium]|nr:hypothetical protein [Candidatus Kerfeldbacteria bacterium]